MADRSRAEKAETAEWKPAPREQWWFGTVILTRSRGDAEEDAEF
jgi:hypothetical protein